MTENKQKEARGGPFKNTMQLQNLPRYNQQVLWSKLLRDSMTIFRRIVDVCWPWKFLELKGPRRRQWICDFCPPYESSS